MLNQRVHQTGHRQVPELKAIKPYDHLKTIAYECARETIGHMIAICSSLIYEEEKKPNPNQKKIDELSQKSFNFAQERLHLRLDDEEKVKCVSETYGKKIKLYHKNRELPF